MADFQLIEPCSTPEIEFSEDPAYNQITSISLLNNEVSGLPEWIDNTRNLLSPENLKTNEKIHKAATFMLGKPWKNLSEWLDFSRE